MIPGVGATGFSLPQNFLPKYIYGRRYVPYNLKSSESVESFMYNGSMVDISDCGKMIWAYQQERKGLVEY